MTPRPSQPTAAAFTLIEYIGVVAVMAVLTGVLMPRVLGAIENTRLSHTVCGIRSARVAAVAYFGRYGRFAGAGGGRLSAQTTDWSAVLVQENLLEKPINSRLGDHAAISVATVPAGAVPGLGGCFDLSGTGDAPIPAGSQVVMLKLANMSPSDAWALSKRLDGTALSAPDAVQEDTLGQVTYPTGGGVVTVYLIHLPAEASAAGPGSSGDTGKSPTDLQ